MTTEMIVEFAAVAGVVLILSLLLSAVNLKRKHRERQAPLLLLTPLLVLAAVLLVCRYYDWTEAAVLDYMTQAELEDYAAYGGSVTLLLLNVVIGLGCFALRLLLLPISGFISTRKNARNTLAQRWYEYDPGEGRWFLRRDCVNLRQLCSVLYHAWTCLTILLLSVMCIAGEDSAYFLRVFPCAVLVVLAELANVLDGELPTKEANDFNGTGIQSAHEGSFAKLRSVYETLLPTPLLISHTGTEYTGHGGATALIRDLQESDDPADRLLGDYFDGLPEKNGFYDVDMIAAASDVMHHSSVVVFKPFYRDQSDYILMPMVDRLLHRKKCLIIVGRTTMEEDVASWAEEILYRYSATHGLWRVARLDRDPPQCDVGILSFANLYDIRMLTSNRDFLAQTGFVLLLEPSRMLATSQVGLGLVAELLAAKEKPTYYVCDHELDGLVDTLSHVLYTEFTHVVAAASRSIYTAMGWSAAGDFKHQQLFGKQTRYLGGGIELAAIALKNQVPRVSWYGEDKAPIKDISWIAGQYYPQICKFANLPNQQKALYEHIGFCSNLWGAQSQNAEFIIAEDELNNLFATLRTYIAQGREQSFVNVLSENYLLRDYMRYNRQLFLSDARAVPNLAPGYAKTQRNTVLRLILMMAASPVPENRLQHELDLMGSDADDLYKELCRLIREYTFVDGPIVVVTKQQELDEDLVPADINYYSIRPGDFDLWFADSLKNAFYVVEDERFGREYIDARLFGQIAQMALPGQYLTQGGKYYRVRALNPKVGCVLNRAADAYTQRRYYRQLRTYHLEEAGELLASRRIMDLELTRERRSFSVETTGYLEMPDNNDLRQARVVDLSADPEIGITRRAYRNKEILSLEFPELTPEMRNTLCILLSELFRTLFPDAWPYLAVVCDRAADENSMLDKAYYHLDGSIDPQRIYILEDSDLDLGLLDAVENNLLRMLEILQDYLDWHMEKMREHSHSDPVLKDVTLPEIPEEEKKKQHAFSRILNRLDELLNNLRRKKEESETPAEPEKQPEEPQPEADTPAAPEAASAPEAEPVPSRREKPLLEKDPSAYLEIDESFDINREQPLSEPSEEAPAEEEQPLPPAARDILVPEEEKLAVHTDGDDLEPEPAVGDDLDLVMPIEPSRYQKECYLKFGFEEIDRSLKLREVRDYLRLRGWYNGELTRARKRDIIDPGMALSATENHCDFCGRPLSGIHLERLADGRIRCNDCSATVIRDLSEFEELFWKTQTMMESCYSIQYTAPIAVSMTDAHSLARMQGRVFQPTTEVAGRVLGFARMAHGKYSLVVENGSPRMATINTVAHELTHIWQYQNWKQSDIAERYGKKYVELIYEGMAMWSEIQLLYILGETSEAQEQERQAEQRCDVYGIGFNLYRERYGILRDGTSPQLTPFHTYPPL